MLVYLCMVCVTCVSLLCFGAPCLGTIQFQSSLKFSYVMIIYVQIKVSCVLFISDCCVVHYTSLSDCGLVFRLYEIENYEISESCWRRNTSNCCRFSNVSCFIVLNMPF